MMSSMPPDGFADEHTNSGPPDGFADDVPQGSLLRRTADAITGAESRIGSAIAPILSPIARAIEPYTRSQFGSPSQLLQSVQPLMSKAANYVGDKANEALSQGSNKVDPYTAAAIGTAASMAPDMAMSMGPSSESTIENNAKPLFRSISQPMAQRALGFTKRFLNTPFARGKAAQAADVALEKNVIPYSGNPSEAMNRAKDLEQSSGEALGTMRESAGKSPIDPVFDSLEAARQRATNGLRGGAWDTVHKKFDEAQETLLSLVNQGENVSLKSVEQAKKLLGKTVNWIADNVSQESAKQITSAIENGVETIMKSKGIDMGAYQGQKRIFGATKLMQKGLQNEVSAQAGNNAVSLPTMVMGAGRLATGDIPGAAATVGLTEALRRRGAGIGASTIEAGGKFLGRQLQARPPIKSLSSGTVIPSRIFSPLQPTTDSIFKSSDNNKRLFNQPNAPADDISNSSQSQMPQPNYNGNEQSNQNNDASNIESGSQHPGIIPAAKTLTKEIARKFLDLANGSKDLARELARKAGYSW